MNLNTSLKGRLKNTNLPVNNALLPLFEAVVNSIQSIDERISILKDIDMSSSYINIKVIRSTQTVLPGYLSDIVAFQITDNGIGFTDENYESFCTLDSEYKSNKGCHGIGRLLWLKAYGSISIKSIYKDQNRIKKRCFKFTSEGILDENCESIKDENKFKTIIRLNDIKNIYSKKIPKKIDTIAFDILDHCLWYFLREGSAPIITIEDELTTVVLNNIYDDVISKKAESEIVKIGNYDFEITHVKLRKKIDVNNDLFYSGANRLVKGESLKKYIPSLFGLLADDDGDFIYHCYVSSQYLTDRVSAERLTFNIPENKSEIRSENFELDGFIDEKNREELCFSDIRKIVVERVRIFLDEYLQNNIKKSEDRINQFIDTKSPRYKSLMKYIPVGELGIDPNAADKEIEEKLHSCYIKIEDELIKEGHEVLYSRNMDDNYQQKLVSYLGKVSDLKKSDLANYVCHRKVIISLLEDAIQKQNNDKYVKESIVHNLIMPMQKNSDEVFFNECNLWLIDERLAFHNFLASDKTIKSMPITDCDSTKEPDIISLNVYDNPLLINNGCHLPLASITVVEFKRPMRNDVKNDSNTDPITQSLEYLELIRSGDVKTKNGRPIQGAEDVPGFCYIICDTVDSVKRCCRGHDLKVTSDKMGYFGYHSEYKAYIEVCSYDRLLNMARERNYAFFEKLGIPVS